MLLPPPLPRPLCELALVLLVPLMQKIIFLKSLLPCLFGIAISGLALVFGSEPAVFGL